MNIFQDAQGNYSSKRTLGIIYLLIALLMAVLDQVTKYEINSFEVWLSVMVAGGSFLGITLFEGKGKQKITNFKAKDVGGEIPKTDDE